METIAGHASAVPAPTEQGDPAAAAALVDFLRERDIACPLCRYNLRGLTTPRCPECGRQLELRVGLSEPRQGAWLVCQIALAATGGIGVLAAATTAKDGWPSYSRVQWLFNACFMWYLLSIPLAAGCVWQRRKYLRMEIATQRFFAVVAVIAAVSSIAGLLIAGG